MREGWKGKKGRGRREERAKGDERDPDMSIRPFGQGAKEDDFGVRF
jgi:hypothetical protein